VKKRCFIAGAGEYTGLVLPGTDDYIIAADAGYAELISRGIIPDLVVGDFDSLGAVPDHPNIVSSPAEKDDTDMMLAVKEGLSLGFDMFVIDGGLDGRLDHTIANLQVLVYLSRNGARGILLGRKMCVTAVTDGSISFHPGRQYPELELSGCDPIADTEAGMRGVVSVFSVGDAAMGVTLTGLKYPLDNATITCDYPIGVSNEFTGMPATISVNKGTLLVIWSVRGTGV